MDTIVRITEALESIATSLQELAGSKQQELPLTGQRVAASPSSTLPPPVAVSAQQASAVSAPPPPPPLPQPPLAASENAPKRRKRRTREEMEADTALPPRTAPAAPFNLATAPAEQEDEWANAPEEAYAAPRSVTRTVEVSTPAPARPPAPKPQQPEPEPETFDYALLRHSIQKLATAYGSEGRDKAISLLRSYGVPKADQVPPAEWPAMFDKVEAMIAALEAEVVNDPDNFA